MLASKAVRWFPFLSWLERSRAVLGPDRTLILVVKGLFVLEAFSRWMSPDFPFDFASDKGGGGRLHKVRAWLQKETYECDRTETLQKKSKAGKLRVAV